VLAEDAEIGRRYDSLVRRLLKKPGRAIPLRRLFKLTEYPRDVGVLYAQGYSVTRFLVEQKSHKTFLAFVKAGWKGAWDQAVRDHYGYSSVDELEEAWLKSLGHTMPLDPQGAPRPESFAKRNRNRSRDEKKQSVGGPPSPAWVVVTVPANAHLTVDGAPTRATSTVRTFETPSLVPGKVYAYTFEVRFNQDGRTVKWSRDVRVEAGKTVRIDMSRETVSVASK
jgi:uncharacterized protein (TIGR03000 family)